METLSERTKLFQRFLEASGVSTESPHLQRTAERFASWFFEQLQPEEFTFTIFDSDTYDQLIAVGPIWFSSLCAHHLLPIIGNCWIAYLPSKRGVGGLSKFARAVRKISKGLNIQELFTQRLADFLFEKLDPRYLIVVSRAEHHCMVIRGAESPGTVTTCSAILPKKEQSNAALKEEAFRLWRMA